MRAVLLIVKWYYSAYRRHELCCCFKFISCESVYEIKIVYDWVLSVWSSLDTNLTTYSCLKRISIVLWREKLLFSLHEQFWSLLHLCWRTG